MENNLITSQITFYIIGSIVIILIGTLLAIALYHFISITRDLRKASSNFKKVTDTAGNSLSILIEQLLKLPVLASIISYFINKNKEGAPKQNKKSTKKEKSK